ncbi:phosphonate ABC transporter, permease protein PhnE [Achromobacter xylosoxidans]|uniref:phosphonate ABC transporter, permease protein PhnE n=1 Tax=Alcaligenes xylosoxydans xylosoxydans TaxID=85698 RepID=UPI000B48F08E|nr:phosphonate ABC transporter, permease protein PhnE [Achromobacter xylosoxidans]
MNTQALKTPAGNAAWRLDPPYGARALLIVIAALMLFLYTGQRVEMGRMAALTLDGALAAVGLKEQSQVTSGLGALADNLFPLQVSYRTETSRIEGFDPDRLPWLAHVETVQVTESRLNPHTLKMEDEVSTQTYLVEPLGYLWRVAVKMVETFEIAIWATLLAVLGSAPLAYCSARNYAPNRLLYVAARAIVSMFRAMPELICALFLVLAYGFGPIAGVLALAIHSMGFLGKFYAEDIETADTKPQEALAAIGASKPRVLAYAVLPQVMPKFTGYTLYILDRNVRMATVVGLVGAGGIGQELKGRYDMYQYAHVGTILVVIFITVFLLDQVAARLRRRLS